MMQMMKMRRLKDPGRKKRKISGIGLNYSSSQWLMDMFLIRILPWMTI